MRTGLLAAVVTLALSLPVGAAPMEEVTLAPVQHENAALVVVGADGSETRYTPADLEGFATYRLRTTSPWREDAADFDGVLLSDILAAHGLSGQDVKVTAENDYAASFGSELVASVPILVATRVNDAPHSRRARGPIQFMIADEDMANSELTTESHLVWMAARIEAE